MTNGQAKLTPEELENLKKCDNSISHWSIEIAKGLLQVDDMKANCRAAYLARQRIIQAAYKAAGIDPESVRHAELAEDGTLHAFIDEAPPGEPSDSAPSVEGA